MLAFTQRPYNKLKVGDLSRSFFVSFFSAQDWTKVGNCGVGLSEYGLHTKVSNLSYHILTISDTDFS